MFTCKSSYFHPSSLLFTVTFLMTCVSSSALSRSNEETDTEGGIAGQYCGLYSVSRLATFFGKDIRVREYANSRFVSQPAGSTAEDLVAILEANEIRARKMGNLSGLELMISRTPWIANVRQSPIDKEFQHWVCVHPSQNGVTVYDGPSPGIELSLSEFLAVWNGFAIVPEDISWVIWVKFLRLALVILCVLFVAGVHNRIRKTVSATISVLAITCFVFLVFFLLSAFWGHHRSATEIATAPWETYDLHAVDLPELISAKNAGSKLIDARFSSDFRAGTIANALNVPINASYASTARIVKTIQKEEPIIVFCQSRRCGFDEIVARRLVSMGYKNVLVAKEGWVEYQDFARE